MSDNTANNETKKKMRLSILTRIALLFLLSLVVAAVFLAAIGYWFANETSVYQRNSAAEAVATAAKTALGSKKNLERLEYDEEFKDKLHGTFRYICSRTGAKYLYLYRIDEDQQRSFFVVAGNADEDDQMINELTREGDKGHDSLYQSETEILDGDHDSKYVIIDNQFGRTYTYLLPIIDEDKLLGIVGVDYDFKSVNDRMLRNFRNLFLLLLTVFALVFVLALFLIKKMVMRPIEVLSEKMRNFAFERDGGTVYDAPKHRFEDEMTDIEGAFNEMARDINSYVDDISVLMKEKYQTRMQLEVAQRIQSGIVPLETGISGDEYDIFACEHPAREVGGDFYDIFANNAGNICIVIGDVSGKGISAALFMVMVKTTIRENLKAGRSLSDTLEQVNREICLSNPENMFATVLAMMIDIKTGVVRFVNAGHIPPLILKKDPEYLSMYSGMALGLFEDGDFKEESLELGDGEGLLIFTDGLTEAVDAGKVQYGTDRLQETVVGCNSSGTVDPASLTKSLVASVKEYSKGLEQFDDITCITFIYRKNTDSKRELSLDLDSFNTVKKTIIGSFGENEKTRSMILACEEIFVNIVSYSKAQRVGFFCKRTDDSFSVVFYDDGIPFDPTKRLFADRDFEDLDMGGIGIMIARNSSREMVYSRIDGKNILKLVFEV